jgi:hypothetical protein
LTFFIQQLKRECCDYSVERENCESVNDSPGTRHFDRVADPVHPFTQNNTKKTSKIEKMSSLRLLSGLLRPTTGSFKCPLSIPIFSLHQVKQSAHFLGSLFILYIAAVCIPFLFSREIKRFC